MKKALLPIAATLLFAAAAVAQTPAETPSGSQGTQSSSPAMQQGQSDTMPGGQQSSGQTAKTSEKKMKGCVQSENGQYVLQTRHGKSIPLSGQDVSGHVGHTVMVHGMWMSGESSSGMSQSSTSGGMKAFNVTSVDMVSESCQMSGSKGSSSGSMPNQQPQ